MALTEVYVDPSIAADSGSGTKGSPYGDLEYAIEQTTFDTTNGTRINIKAGTAEVLAAELGDAMDDTATTVAWVTSATAFAVFEGYTTDEGDGGIGEISGGGSVSILNDIFKSNIVFRNLKLHNTGASRMFDGNTRWVFDNCEIYNSALSGGAMRLPSTSTVVNCYFHNHRDDAIDCSSSGVQIINNRIEDYGEVSGVAYGIINLQSNSYVARNIIVPSADRTDAGGIEVNTNAVNTIIEHNSLYAPTASTGTAIEVGNSTSIQIANNIIEGWSGAGGGSINHGTSGRSPLIKGNAIYNCTNTYDYPAVDIGLDYTDAAHDNETLTASAFTDAANGDFTPVDTDNIKEGSLPDEIGLVT